MKVIREGFKKFLPITILIETEQEAEVLWHYLNMPSGASLEECFGEMEDIGWEEADGIVYELWEQLNETFTPEGC